VHLCDYDSKLKKVKPLFASVMNFNEKAFDFIYGIIAFWLFFDYQASKAN
jgi:hypothetical protein